MIVRVDRLWPDRCRKLRRCAASGDRTLQMCPIVALTLPEAAVRRQRERWRSGLRTSLSFFLLLRASIAAISRIDLSTFPCSPNVSIFSVPPWMANSTSAISLSIRLNERESHAAEVTTNQVGCLWRSLLVSSRDVGEQYGFACRIHRRT